MSVVQILSLFQLLVFLCRLLETCEQVSVCGEQVVSCLNQQMRQYHQASEAAQEVSGKMEPPCFKICIGVCMQHQVLT